MIAENIVRLTEAEVNCIRQSLQAIDPQARIYLFGSRTRDDARGGDIDLLIEADDFDNEKKAQLHWDLLEQLGEQKIDIVVASEKNKLFVESIKTEVIPL